MIYWINFTNLSFDELAVKIGLFYYSAEIDKANIYVLSTFIKRLQIADIQPLVRKLKELSKKNNVSGIKFYSEEDDDSLTEGKVQVMTMHKAKGDEFDYVFIPEMSEKCLPVSFNEIVLRKNVSFLENLRKFSQNYKPKTDIELKKSILEENLRLLYVAITRAKRKLFITVAKNNKLKSEPNYIFNLIEESI